MSWIKYAEPGDRIVCVDAGPGDLEQPTNIDFELVVGRTYTLFALTFEFGAPAVQVEELPRTYWENNEEYEGWLRADRFRPLQTRLTDISIFVDMLKRKPVDASV
jgi:hypothetical protein